VTVKTDSGTELHVVARLEDFPPGSRRLVEAGPHGVGVFNVGGEIVAVTNLCPHMGAPLCLGRVTGTTRADEPYVTEWVRDGEILRCPWHGWEFDLRTGTTITEPPRRVRRHEVHVRDGLVLVEA
jgi:nitrite reductase/ring-hydroxylating ferredoxin subunit